MPIGPAFSKRLLPILGELAREYGTPFHVYDQTGIAATHRALVRAFNGSKFRQYFAVKALPNPAVLDTLLREGSGFDCSSPVELRLAEQVGASGSTVVFTPNNVASAEYELAMQLGALVTFDDRAALAQLRELPPVVAFRVAPNAGQSGTILMGDQAHSKFGVPHHEAQQAYREAWDRGARRFGIHSMTIANELDADRMAQAAVQLVELAARISDQLGVPFEYINFGGGPGIPSRPGEAGFRFDRYACAIRDAVDKFFGVARQPAILLECGRCVTGPHGVLVTTVVSKSIKGRIIVGVDASMSALMRPAMYPTAYHHITSPLAVGRMQVEADVVGPLCENNDKFGVSRTLPDPRLGDILLIHDCGAHGHSMGFNYNGRLRPAELMLTHRGDVVEIRRRETFEDYVATVGYREVPLRLRQPSTSTIAGS